MTRAVSIHNALLLRFMIADRTTCTRDSHAMINSSIFTHRCNASVHSHFSFRYICVVHTPSISPAACGGFLLCGCEPLKGVPALFKPRVRGCVWPREGEKAGEPESGRASTARADPSSSRCTRTSNTRNERSPSPLPRAAPWRRFACTCPAAR